MLYNQRDFHDHHRQKQHDIFAQLRAYRQQLAAWNQSLADAEQRLTVFRRRQQILIAQIATWRRERDYLIERMEHHERKKLEEQQKHRHDSDS